MPDPIACRVYEQWRQTYPADHPYHHGGVPPGPYLGRSR